VNYTLKSLDLSLYIDTMVQDDIRFVEFSDKNLLNLKSLELNPQLVPNRIRIQFYKLEFKNIEFKINNFHLKREALNIILNLKKFLRIKSALEEQPKVLEQHSNSYNN